MEKPTITNYRFRRIDRMKTINKMMAGFCLAVTFASCTPKMTFLTSSTVPSASGTVGVKKDKNSNYVMQVEVRNLAEPKNLNPARNTYLVWMENNNSTKKLGQIMPSGRALEAKLRATSTDKPDNIFITAEDNAEIQYPDGQLILTTKK